MDHSELTAEMSEHITLYALSTPGQDTDVAFREHISACSICRQEFQAVQSTLGVLGYSAPAASPAPELKARLLARVQMATETVSLQPVQQALMKPATLLWEPSDYPGVSFHWLRRDAASGTIAAFVKVQPGSHYAIHRHLGGEDCLVLQGGFRDSRGEYHAGDFVYYEPGSVHHSFQALEGEECLLFVVAHGGLEILSEGQGT